MKEACAEHPLDAQPTAGRAWVQRRRCTLCCNETLAQETRHQNPARNTPAGQGSKGHGHVHRLGEHTPAIPTTCNEGLDIQAAVQGQASQMKQGHELVIEGGKHRGTLIQTRGTHLLRVGSREGMCWGSQGAQAEESC